jgi:class 3 adenylate cyclase
LKSDRREPKVHDERRGTGRHWLNALGLGQYLQVLIDNAIDFETLPNATDDQLKDLGVRPAHRKILLSAASSLAMPNRTDTPGQRVRLQLAATTKAERRQLTALFSDLVGSTELSSVLDPEDLRDVIRLYQATCADVIAQHGGFVAQYQGDGIVVYFGYPSAREDDAERAVRAALDILRAVAKLNMSGGVRIEVRLGIATGMTVVGDLIGQGASAVTEVAGQAPNLAARLQAFAAPGTIVIADATRRLVGGLFEYEDLGQQRFKGIHDDVPVWRVIDEREHAIRYEAMRSERSGRIVDRSKEMAVLNAEWEQAQAGKGRVVLLLGDAGNGKSCLLHCLGTQITEAAAIRVPLQCSAHYRDSPLYPLIAHLQRAAGFEQTDTTSIKLDKIERMLATGNAAQEAALVAALLSLSLHGSIPTVGNAGTAPEGPDSRTSCQATRGPFGTQAGVDAGRGCPLDGPDHRGAGNPARRTSPEQTGVGDCGSPPGISTLLGRSPPCLRHAARSFATTSRQTADRGRLRR